MKSFVPGHLLTKLSVVMTMVILLQYTSQCKASDHTISLKSIGNGTTTATGSICVGRSVDECLIAEQDLDLELEMPSEISRRALASANYNTQCKLNPKCRGICGSTGGSCAGQKGKKYIGKCNSYNRNC
ncbi:hypothetical protein TIFTF001_033086 [Ficus carica]|uniref:Uncharacterized protein n=1 Tax=Ficus carica TaxID=3494 RepID=A0AA87ZFU4_FICCA|nr:hypothetical protein TIFTF001_050295 [Ficus carica]GMN23946.1 hypothetical protein TIFTF001_050296 [Ficus carica]GMN64005.1 hypothetical protein TIFTF001_033086 [Ficus carica]